MATPQGHNLDVGGGNAALTRTTTPKGHPDTWAYADPNTTATPQGHLNTWAKNTPTSQPDTTRCSQVGRETFAVCGTHMVHRSQAPDYNMAHMTVGRPQGRPDAQDSDDYDSILVIEIPVVQPTMYILKRRNG